MNSSPQLRIRDVEAEGHRRAHDPPGPHRVGLGDASPPRADRSPHRGGPRRARIPLRVSAASPCARCGISCSSSERRSRDRWSRPSTWSAPSSAIHAARGARGLKGWPSPGSTWPRGTRSGWRPAFRWRRSSVARLGPFRPITASGCSRRATPPTKRRRASQRVSAASRSRWLALARPGSGLRAGGAPRVARRRRPHGRLQPSLTVVEALRRGRALDGEGVAWIEEPVRADDFRGRPRCCRAHDARPDRRELAGPFQMAEAFRLGAIDLVMPDVQQIGGVTAGFARRPSPTLPACRARVTCSSRSALTFSR